MDDLRRKAPKVYNAMMQGVAMQTAMICKTIKIT